MTDLAIRMLRKGIISLSPKILATYLFFLVSAVGLIMELITKSSNSTPNCFRAHVFTLPNPLPSGNPRNGLVITIPETFRYG